MAEETTEEDRMKRIVLALAVLLLLAASVSAQWISDSKENLLTGEKSFYVASMAEVSQGTLRDASVLIRWLPNGEMEAFVNWGGYSVKDNAPTFVRFGTETAVPLVIECLSGNGESQFLLYPDRFLAKLRTMKPEDTFVIQAARAAGSVTTVARWKVGDLDAVLKTSGR
jgi:hypothetical protein